MSVILQIANLGISQGWTGQLNTTLTNSGDENIKEIRVKIIDSTIFTSLHYHISGAGHVDCLNVFPTGVGHFVHNFTDGSTLFPAGTTKAIRFTLTIKDDAPIQVNNLLCYWQYIVY